MVTARRSGQCRRVRGRSGAYKAREKASATLQDGDRAANPAFPKPWARWGLLLLVEDGLEGAELG